MQNTSLTCDNHPEGLRAKKRLQSGNKIDREKLNAKVNLRYCMTLNRQVMIKITSEGHISVEVFKVYMHTKYGVFTDYHHILG